MSYRLNNSGEFWADGVFCVPNAVAERLMNFADENKLKALLIILSSSGKVDIDGISSRLKISKDEAEEAVLFWVNEGVIADSDEPYVKPKEEAPTETKKAYESLPVPNLTPHDIVVMCSENPELADLLRSSEKALKSTLSNSMKSNIINMATYYGLPVPVIITLLEYYKSERDKGKSITTRNLQNMAREWAEEDIHSLEAASAKLQNIEDVKELWSEVLSKCEIDYRKPSSAQNKMLSRWLDDFSKDMIFFACNTMKKYTDEDKKSVKVVDNILKEWKRKGFKTPEDVKAQPKKEKSKTAKSKKLKRKPSFDIDEIAKKAKLNDNYDI